MSEERKYYELAYLINAPEKVEEIKSLLNKLKVEIFNEGEVKKLNLAYPIKKQNQAYFGYLNFLTEPDKILEIDKQLKYLDFVLRFLIVKMNKYYLKSLLKDKEEIKNKEEQADIKNIVEEKSLEVESEILSNEVLEKKLEEILNQKI